jgi:serine/threonine protein kinase
MRKTRFATIFWRRASELVASASFGVRHHYLEKPVAIKAIFRRHVRDNQFYQRFLLEAISMARLGPPNIVGAHEFYAVGGK